MLLAHELCPDLILVGNLPRSGLLAASRQLGQIVAVVMVIATIISAALMLIVLRVMIIARVGKLETFAKEIGRGNSMALLRSAPVMNWANWPGNSSSWAGALRHRAERSRSIKAVLRLRSPNERPN